MFFSWIFFRFSFLKNSWSTYQKKRIQLMVLILNWKMKIQCWWIGI